MIELYKRIRALRESLKMTQDMLAEKTGYSSRSSIAKIEAGEVDLSQSKIEAFAQALNTTPGYLMGWKDEKPAVTSDDELSDEEWELIKRYRAMSEEAKRIIDKIV